jgi:hypothetical protein
MSGYPYYNPELIGRNVWVPYYNPEIIDRNFWVPYYNLEIIARNVWVSLLSSRDHSQECLGTIVGYPDIPAYELWIIVGVPRHFCL